MPAVSNIILVPIFGIMFRYLHAELSALGD